MNVFRRPDRRPSRPAGSHLGRLASRLAGLFFKPACLLIIGFLAGCAPAGEWPLSPTSSNLPPQSSATPLPLPDLVIQDISIEVSAGGVCDSLAGRLQTRVVIANQGPGVAGPFAISINDRLQTLPQGLASGESASLLIPGYLQETEVIVNPDGEVRESYAYNNHVIRSLPAPTLPPNCQAITPTPVLTVVDPQTTLRGHTAPVLAAAFSPDGSLIASGSIDNTVRLWRVRDGQLLRTMQGHPFPVLALAFSPDGATLATGCADGIIRLWAVSDGDLLATLQGHGGRITSLDFAPGGGWLASGSDDFTVRIWRTSDTRPYLTIDEGMAAISSVAYSPDGKLLGWAEADGTLRLRRLAEATWMTVVRPSSQAALHLAFSPDSQAWAAGFADGSIYVYKTGENEPLARLTGHSAAVTGLAFSPDGSLLVSSSKDHTLRLWLFDASQNAFLPQHVLVGHTGAVNSSAFSPQGSLIVSASDDKTLRVWPAR